MKLLIVVTNVDHYTSGTPTGLWLSELTHMYHRASKHGYVITIASPGGGNTPVDPESLKPAMLDRITRRYWADESFRQELQEVRSLEDLVDHAFDCVYLAGGHGTMYDFPRNTFLQQIIQDHYEKGKLIAAICHGVSGLLHVKLSDGEYLLTNKKVTGFNWAEETLARRNKKVPFSLEAALKKKTSRYSKTLIPMSSKVVTDGNLITGANPFSSKQIAKTVMKKLGAKKKKRRLFSKTTAK